LRCLLNKREIRNCITYTTQFNIVSFALLVSCASAIIRRQPSPLTATVRRHLSLIAAVHRCLLPTAAVFHHLPRHKVLSQYQMTESRPLPLSLPLSATIRYCLRPSNYCSPLQAHHFVRWLISYRFQLLKIDGKHYSSKWSLPALFHKDLLSLFRKPQLLQQRNSTRNIIDLGHIQLRCGFHEQLDKQEAEILEENRVSWLKLEYQLCSASPELLEILRSIKTYYSFWTNTREVFANDFQCLFDSTQKIVSLQQTNHDMVSHTAKARVLLKN
ncbi:hypothetical protein CR513_28448, partial [Mucuna pruriens]